MRLGQNREREESRPGIQKVCIQLGEYTATYYLTLVYSKEAELHILFNSG